MEAGVLIPIDCCNDLLVSGSSVRGPSTAVRPQGRTGSYQQVSAVFLVIFLARLGPVAFGEQHGQRGRGVCVLERLAALQGLFQFGRGNPESIDRKALSGSSVFNDVAGSPQSSRVR